MNGPWYSWGWTHTRAKVFVAAWRHIVDVFRQQGASNVIWLWTVNVDPPNDNAIQNPARWWPGSSYVNWVGIDGYYYKPSWTFAPLFGPTIKIVHLAEPGADSRYSSPRLARRPRTSRRRSPTCSPVFAPTGCSGSYGSTPTASRTGLSPPRQRSPRSGEGLMQSTTPRLDRPGRARLTMLVGVVVAVAAVTYAIVRFAPSPSSPPVANATLPTSAASYLGVYEHRTPHSLPAGSQLRDGGRPPAEPRRVLQRLGGAFRDIVR